MADTEARLIVKVVDQASKALKGIQSNLGGIDKLVQDNSRSIRTFGLTATAAGGAITLALGLAVNAAREQIAAEKQLNAVLASTGGVAGLTADEVKRMASSLQAVTNFGDEAILTAQGVILQFTNIGKDIFPRVSEAALDIAQKLGRGPEGLVPIALQLGKALNDPADAMNALSRAGVVLSDSQANVIKSLVAAGDTAGAQRVLLDELAKSYGGAARAAADPWIQVKNAFDDVAEEIGTQLLPALTSLLQAVLPVIQRTAEWIKQHPQLTQSIVLLTAALGALLTVVGSLSLGLLAVSAALGVVGLSLAVGGALFVAIGGIVALLVVLIQHWDALKTMVLGAVSAMQEAVTNFALTVGEKFGLAEESVRRFLSLAKEAARFSVGGVANALLPGGAAVLNKVTGRAGGGRVNEPLTLVGEQGPELVSLPRGSFVHTAEDTRRMGASVTIGAIHVHNEADEDRLIAKLTRLIQLESLAAS